MDDRAERVVTALLDGIERGFMLARLHGGAPLEAQRGESFPHDRGALPALRPTHFECRLEVPLARPESAEGKQKVETIRLWGELDPSGALLVEGIEVEPRASSEVNDHG